MSYATICPEGQFLRDVSMHQMHIIHDAGVNRHIRFKAPGSMSMHFDLITWPGHLCYTGDMGTYVFRRLEDMFEFFRTDRKYQTLPDGRTLAINPGYWGEKLEAQDSCDGLLKWSEEKFKLRAQQDFDEWLGDADLSDEDKEEAREQFACDVIDALGWCDKGSAYRNMIDFEFNGQSPFQDWWEVSTDEFSFRFLWCCYALAWGVRFYDDAKEAPDA